MYLAAPPWLQRDWDIWYFYKFTMFFLAAPPWLQRDWDFSMGNTLIWSKLAAPPWLQRDWDRLWWRYPHQLACSTSLTSKGLRLAFYGEVLVTHVLQHLPDFKGIETCRTHWAYPHVALQHLPDFKGIETLSALYIHQLQACSTSLTSKGLRPQRTRSTYLQSLQHLPDFKGIETLLKFCSKHCFSCSTSLTSKGLRP